MSETDTYHLFGNLIRFHARGEMGYCLVDVLTAPGAGVPPNTHPGDNEVFCILEGTYAFDVDGQERIAKAGDVVQIPNGAVHALKNIGDSPARMFIFNIPGRIHAEFFATLGEPMPVGARDFPPPADNPPDIPRLIAQARGLGVIIQQ
ncbi:MULTISPECIES: cupin domain-containing protein [unclassified Chelatococcus]|uniref:cupin domain-containing protein n=1 Tax=unclassified Chelatococcus TaxID=2638111 RepID=UPI001BCF1FC1|nr:MULTISPECIES: cupin domain-containing protein [unclassified Chelatococcus]MBS7699966.1 cupin domain-containing protein [Chelatococcus sp. YT9]MBX3558609.1 cupin domain-containing protein [Chelatococcus sp.]